MSILNRPFFAAHYPIKQCPFLTDHSLQHIIQSSSVGIITNNSVWNIIKVFLYPSACHVLLFNIKYVDRTMEHTHPNVVFLERKLLLSVLEMPCDSKVQTDHEGKQQVEQ